MYQQGTIMLHAVLAFLAFTTVVDGFSLLPKANPKLKTSASANEAVEVYFEKYPVREPTKASPFVSFGMPYSDIDGTVLKKTGERSGKRMSDIDEKYARECFSELGKLYGERSALEMVRIMPLVLAFDKKQFGPSLREYTSIFGEDDSKAMVLRNPGLLAIKSDEAAKATDQTVTFSYIVAATRPASPVLLPGLFFLLLTPLLEKLTGFPIRETLLPFAFGS